MSKNLKLNKARQAKFDEFYTQLSDIEKELSHYKSHFKNKVVLCNCDDPRISNFFHYLSYNFEVLGLKKLITTCYKNQQRDMFSQNDSQRAIYLEYTGAKRGKNVPSPEEIGVKELEGDGDFRSAECIELLKQADIVVTNPPFSLFREYVAQLIEYDKKFLIIGNLNAITYKEIFKLIQDNKVWLGQTSSGMWFELPNSYERPCKTEDGKKYTFLGTAAWYTNLEITKRHEELILYRTYKGHEKDYPKYDNYDAINVDKTIEIPIDYDGVMGVPVSFLTKYNPEQFEIIGSNRGIDQDTEGIYGRGSYLNDNETFKRLFIRNKKVRR